MLLLLLLLLWDQLLNSLSLSLSTHLLRMHEFLFSISQLCVFLSFISIQSTTQN